MTKHYHYSENILSSQNRVSKPNVVWVADMTSFELDKGKKVHVFFCIDIFTNVIVACKISKKTIGSKQVISALEKSISKRILLKPRRKLIIHTDRGTQFSSKAYKEVFTPSMSRANKPKNNAVVERFIRTLKEHKINDITLQEEFFHQIEINSKFKGYRKVYMSEV